MDFNILGKYRIISPGCSAIGGHDEPSSHYCSKRRAHHIEHDNRDGEHSPNVRFPDEKAGLASEGSI